MKRLIKTAVIIAACAGLCAGVWPQNGTSKKVPAEPVKSTVSAKLPTMSAPACALPIEGAALQATISTEEEGRVTTTTTVSNTADASPAAKEAFKSTAAGLTPTATTSSDDPYHTDVYPENVYSEEYLYDADGNLIGKTIISPTAFGPDTIWIGGHAYYDIPGFGLIEWSGPSSVTEDYTMYENGNKVGIMGGEEGTAAVAVPSGQSEEQPEPAGEVINQTINALPEKNSTPADYRPDTTPPDDPNARDVG